MKPLFECSDERISFCAKCWLLFAAGIGWAINQFRLLLIVEHHKDEFDE